MKKVLSLVLAFALVLSVASVAFGAWDAAADTPKGKFKLTFTKYEPGVDDLTNDYYLANANIGAVNGVIAYYSIKLEIPKEHGIFALGWWPPVPADDDSLLGGMSFTLDFGDGIQVVGGTPGPFTHPDDVDVPFIGMGGGSLPVDDDETYVLYYQYGDGANGGSWTTDKTEADNLIVITDSSKATLKACLTYNADISIFSFDGSDDDDWSLGIIVGFMPESGNDLLIFFDGDLFSGPPLFPLFGIERDSKGKFVAIYSLAVGLDVIEDVVGEGLKAGGKPLSPAEKAALDDLLSALGISSFSALKKSYFTNANLRANLTDSFKVCSDTVWGAYTPDPLLVAIPKTGGSAGVIGLAMVMVAIAAAAVAVKKIKA